MTHDEIIAAQPPVERRFSLACDAVKRAREAFKRSKSKKNLAAFHVAEAEYEAALAALKAEHYAERVGRVREYLEKRKARSNSQSSLPL